MTFMLCCRRKLKLFMVSCFQSLTTNVCVSNPSAAALSRRMKSAFAMMFIFSRHLKSWKLASLLLLPTGRGPSPPRSSLGWKRIVIHLIWLGGERCMKFGSCGDWYIWVTHLLQASTSTHFAESLESTFIDVWLRPDGRSVSIWFDSWSH